MKHQIEKLNKTQMKTTSEKQQKLSKVKSKILKTKKEIVQDEQLSPDLKLNLDCECSENSFEIFSDSKCIQKSRKCPPIQSNKEIACIQVEHKHAHNPNSFVCGFDEIESTNPQMKNIIRKESPSPILLDRNVGCQGDTIIIGMKGRYNGISRAKSDNEDEVNLLGKFNRFKLMGNSSRNKESFVRANYLSMNNYFNFKNNEDSLNNSTPIDLYSSHKDESISKNKDIVNRSRSRKKWDLSR